VHSPLGETQTAIAIPASALRKGPTGDHVFVVQEDRTGALRAHVRSVQVATIAGDEVVVEQGLASGERVAASGSFKLRDAALVSVMERPEALAANRNGAHVRL
jgi:membrane fusion protein (multidrug efflux system)